MDVFVAEAEGVAELVERDRRHPDLEVGRRTDDRAVALARRRGGRGLRLLVVEAALAHRSGEVDGHGRLIGRHGERVGADLREAVDGGIVADADVGVGHRGARHPAYELDATDGAPPDPDLVLEVARLLEERRGAGHEADLERVLRPGPAVVQRAQGRGPIVEADRLARGVGGIERVVGEFVVDTGGEGEQGRR